MCALLPHIRANVQCAIDSVSTHSKFRRLWECDPPQDESRDIKHLPRLAAVRQPDFMYKRRNRCLVLLPNR